MEGRVFSVWLSNQKESHCDHSCCHSCHLHKLPCLHVVTFVTHMESRTTELCGNYGRCMCHPFAACTISVDHCSINCRGNAKTWISCISGGSLCVWISSISCISAVQEAVTVSLQSHTASFFPCWSVLFHFVCYSNLPHNYVILTCSSGSLYRCKVGMYCIVPGKRPWALAAQAPKILGWAVTQRRCLNGSTILTQVPPWMSI